jgi:pterin-4a-carbinolamine dehydratase
MPKPSPSVLKELKGLEDWELVGRELTKGFYLKSFSDAVAFISDVAKTANVLQHHPDILLSEFSTIRLFIKTNEFGTVTMKDIEFAKKVEGLWKRKWKKREKTAW